MCSALLHSVLQVQGDPEVRQGRKVPGHVGGARCERRRACAAERPPAAAWQAASSPAASELHNCLCSAPAAVWSLTAKGDRYVQNPAGAGNPYETMKASFRLWRCCWFPCVLQPEMERGLSGLAADALAADAACVGATCSSSPLYRPTLRRPITATARPSRPTSPLRGWPTPRTTQP